jgi:hypothetical protein
MRRGRRGTSPRSSSLLVSGMYLGGRSEQGCKTVGSALVEQNTWHHLRKRPTSCEFSAMRAVFLCTAVCHLVAL